MIDAHFMKPIEEGEQVFVVKKRPQIARDPRRQDPTGDLGFILEKLDAITEAIVE